jgi:hypothetical protein
MQAVTSPFELPEYVSALQRERVVRDMAAGGMPEFIGSFPAAPLTLWHHTVLRLMGSPMLPPFDTPTEAELTAFLWLVHPEYRKGSSPPKWFIRACRLFCPPRKPLLFRWRYEREKEAATTFMAETIVAARQYVMDSLQDALQSSGADSERPDYYCDAVAICAAMARNYGFAEEYVMRMPLKMVFQYLKEIVEFTYIKRGQPAVLWNPSDRVTAEYLEKLNRRN